MGDPNQINVGDEVQWTAAVSDGLTQQPVSPTTGQFTVRDPAGNLTTPATTNPSVGVFQTTFTITSAGMWTIKFVGTGAAPVVGYDYISVPAPPF